MGNGNSRSDSINNLSYQNQQIIQKLQRQILENQLKMQRMQMNQYQNRGSINRPTRNINSNPFTNPVLREEIMKNPSMRRKFLERIIEIYGEQMSQKQYKQINDYFTSLDVKENVYQPATKNFLHINQGTRDYSHQARELVAQQQEKDVNTLSSKYRDDNERERREFEIEERRRRQEFNEKQRKRKMEFQTKLKQFENQNIDALRLFQLPKNYTLEQLKQAYKKLAIKTHPDKPQGSKQKFQLVTKSYFLLVEKYKKKQQDKQFMDLRNESQKYIKKQRQNTGTNIHMDKEKFNPKLFNKLYEENRLDNPNDKGYEDWLRNGEDISDQPKIFSDKFNINVFNNMFEKMKDQETDNANNEVVQYRQPNAIVSAERNMNYTDIDVYGRHNTNFTKAAQGRDRLGYTDLKSAYTKTKLINTSQVQMKQYRNLDELERERSNIDYEMSSQQIEMARRQKIEDERRERLRKERIRERDNQIAQTYTSIHKRMLGYGPKNN